MAGFFVPVGSIASRRKVMHSTNENRRHGYEASFLRGVVQMAAVAKALSRILWTDVDVETLKTIIMFCGVGLTVLLMCLSYGVDLSPGFF
jgi:hypothetical protein